MQEREHDSSVEGRPGVFRGVTPVKKLSAPMNRFLPPADEYYDQSTLASSGSAFDVNTRCVLCCNEKCKEDMCKCPLNCALCGTKEHRGRECSKLYADITWWRANGHDLRKKAQRRPEPGEQACLVTAGVFEDRERSSDPIVVNMKHPDVKAFYKDGVAPRALRKFPWIMQSTSTPITAESGALNIQCRAGAEQLTASYKHSNNQNIDYSMTPMQPTNIGSLKDHSKAYHAGAANLGVIGLQKRIDPMTKKDDRLPDQFRDTWRPLTYHEGRTYAAITPLSFKAAIIAAQRNKIATQPISTGNVVRADLDPRLKGRMKTQQTIHASQPTITPSATQSTMKHATEDSELGASYEACRKELEEARERIKAQTRRIQELELALHELEGLTDAVKYRGGQKRSRD